MIHFTLKVFLIFFKILAIFFPSKSFIFQLYTLKDFLFQLTI